MKEKTANLRWFTRVVVLAAMLVTTILFTLLSSPPAYADTHTSTSTGGLWATAGTWDLGVPAATDSVIIATTGTNRVTLGAAAICAGLTINNGATLCASNSLTVNGLTSVSGTLNISSTTGNKNFNDSVTINPGGIWINRVNEPVNFRGGITNSSGTFTAGTGAYTFITNDQALTGTFLIPTLTVTGVTLTNNDELNVSTALAGTGTLTQGTGATLHLADTSFTTTLVATADGNTVDYSRAGAQTLQATTYNNLTLSGSGAKTFPIGTTTLSGSFLRQGTAALTFNNGSFVNNGGGPIDCGNALITITGNTETTQSIAGFTTTGGISITKATTTPSTVTITGDVNARTLYFTAAATNTTVSLDPGVVVTLTGAFAINRSATGSTTGSTFAVNDGGLSCTTITLGGTTGGTRTSSITISTGTVTASGNIISAGVDSQIVFSDAGTLNAGGTFMSGTAGTFTASTGTVNFNANGAQSIAPFAYTFNNVTLSGSNAKTLTNAIINGILSMEGTATTIGTPTSWGTTLQYKGSAAQTTGTEFPATFSGSGGVIINNANGVDLDESKTITYGLTLTSGIITTGAYTLIIDTGGSTSGGSASSYVYGNLQKNFGTGSQPFTFPIGDAGNYTPVDLASMTVGTAGSLTAYTTAAEHPNVIDDSSDINASASVNRYWTLTSGGGFVASACDATFTFVAGDVDSGADTNAFIVGRYSGSWTYPTVGTKTSTSTQATGLSSFGDFAIGMSKASIEITAPDDISGWILSAGTTNTNSSTLSVVASPSWKTWTVTASDTDPTTAGYMTQWSGTYGTAKLATAMNVSGPSGEVTLPGGGTVATGTGSNPSVAITFKQVVTWNDDPDNYRIVITFIGTIN